MALVIYWPIPSFQLSLQSLSSLKVVLLKFVSEILHAAQMCNTEELGRMGLGIRL